MENTSEAIATQFDNIVGNLPKTVIELKWEDGNGTHEDESHAIDTEAFYICCKLSIYENGSSSSATYDSPAEYVMQSQVIEVEEPLIFVDGDEIELSELQENELKQSIIESLKIQ